MTGFSNLKEIIDAEESGKETTFSWRKVPSQTTPPGVWFDLSMSPGNPVPQYYADSPLTSVVMNNTSFGGLYHGKPLPNNTKILRGILGLTATATPLPLPMMLCDYLMYYPFLDEGTRDEQILDNSSSLNRYSNGVGVNIMAVSVAGRTGGQSFYIKYTNSDGVPDRITPFVVENSTSVVGNIVTSERALNYSSSPFIPLQQGDIGVRSIESVTMNGLDVGLFTLVLVKPLAQMFIRENTAPIENDYLLNFSQLPVIENDAYLNFLCCPSGSLSGVQLMGTLKTVWN